MKRVQQNEHLDINDTQTSFLAFIWPIMRSDWQLFPQLIDLKNLASLTLLQFKNWTTPTLLSNTMISINCLKLWEKHHKWANSCTTCVVVNFKYLYVNIDACSKYFVELQTSVCECHNLTVILFCLVLAQYPLSMVFHPATDQVTTNPCWTHFKFPLQLQLPGWMWSAAVGRSTLQEKRK